MSWDATPDPGGEPGATLEQDWGSFEGKHDRKLVSGAHATPAQRLAWLEEVLQIAWQTGALPRRRPADR
jgi:hypothetical protein